MRKIVCVLLALTAIGTISAQQLQEFPGDKIKFMKTMDEFMKGTQLEGCIQVNQEFQEMNKKVFVFDDQQYDKIVELSNAMLRRKMGPSPYFFNLLTALNAFAKSKNPPVEFVTWADLAIKTCNTGPKGDNKEFAKLLEFSNSLFSKGAINATNSKSWKFDAASFKFATVDGKVKVSFPQGRLVGYNFNESDSMVIKNTSGDYWISANRWDGKDGLVNWMKAGLVPNMVYANIKRAYSINLDKTDFSIDSVEFFHKEYFQAPIIGKYTDKFGSGDADNATYPRFESDGAETEIKDIAPGVDYKGGFSVKGNKIVGFGTPDGKASVTFYKDKAKTQKILTAYFMDFAYKKGESISSLKAQVLLFNDKDTIFHPELTISYNIPKRELRLLRSESAISKSKFIDTYHNIEFEADAIFWNLDSPKMELKTLSGLGQVGTFFESKDYFSKASINKVMGLSSTEPLAAIKILSDKKQTRELYADDVAKAIDPHLSENQAKSLFYELVQGGFIVYDEPTSTIRVRDKLFHFVLSNAKRKDYDNIRLKSVTENGTDYIDLRNSNIELSGVNYIPISDTAAVTFYPSKGYVELQKNRNMHFGGLIYGGRMDFFGKEYKFRYDSFAVDLNTIDSMRINIPNGKTDGQGNAKLMTLRTNIDSIKGRMDIDLPINKAGRTSLWQYPKLTSYDKSYAFYSDFATAGGSYLRKDFYFLIDPFRLDSLNHFSPQVINWKGKLVSGGIFPDIPESIKVQPDLSLGFTTSSPDAGWNLYRGNGNFNGTITLDYRGLTGGGQLSHLTSKFISGDVHFYLDSLWATADSFSIAKSTAGPKTPTVASTGSRVYWKPKTDSMHIYMKNNPFSIYETNTSLKGDLFLSSKGLIGSGSLDFKEATIVSKTFRMVTDELYSDTASMNIHSEFGDKLTFEAPNGKVYVNFKERKAKFESNIPEMPTTFGYNQYKTNIRKFDWDIDRKFLDFSVPPGEQGEFFESIRPSQLGLKFRAKRATYDLKTSILRCEQIPYIRVADAEVVPDSGVVIIRAEAAMDQLKKATIYVDTIDRRYKIENCTLDIISKGELKGNGSFKYSCPEHPNQPILFSSISCQKEVMGMKKTEFIDYSLVANGTIAKTADFYLYPNAKFFGEVSLFGRNEYLYFDGYAQLLFKNPFIKTSEFNIVDDINPNRFFLHYDSVARNAGNARLGLGLYFHKSRDDEQRAYTSIFSPLRDYDDDQMFHPVGVITHNPTTGEYKFGEEAKINGETNRGSVMTYDDKKGIIKGEGGMTLPVQFNIMQTVAAGSMQHELEKNKITLNLTFGIDMRSDKSIVDNLGNLMYVENLDMPDINYGTEKFKAIYHTLADPKADAKILEEYGYTNQFKRPKSLKHTLVFSDVNFVFDTIDFTFRSVGKIGLSFVGDRGIHKKLDGYIEIAPRNSNGDYFNIYLKTANGEWFYFNYLSNRLGMVSSYDEFNRTIGAVAPEKRVVGDRDKGRFYTYTIGSTIDKDVFVDAQKDKNDTTLTGEKAFYRQKTAKDSAEIARIKGGGAPPPLPPSEDEVEPNNEQVAPTPAQKPMPKSKSDHLKEKMGVQEDDPVPAQKAPQKTEEKKVKERPPAKEDDYVFEDEAPAPKKAKEPKPVKEAPVSEEEAPAPKKVKEPKPKEEVVEDPPADEETPAPKKGKKGKKGQEEDDYVFE